MNSRETQRRPTGVILALATAAAMTLSMGATAGCDYDDGSADSDGGVNSNLNANQNDNGNANGNANDNTNENTNQNNNNPTDSDGDGVVDSDDCAPDDPSVYPGNTEVLGNGKDDDCDPTTPDDCSYVHDAALSAGEPSEMAGMTEAHDYWRYRVGVPLASWDTGIATNAQSYVDTCPSGHSSSSSRQNVAGYSYLGENIYFHSSSSADPVAAVDSWASERADYDFGTPTGGTSAMVGHYTQIVWEGSTAIGCGVARCGGSWGTIVVCQYGPGGNYSGQTPYDYSEGQCLDLDNDDVLQMNDGDDTDRSVQ